jgi:hypothetical protein
MQEAMLIKCLVFLQHDVYWTAEDMLRKLMDYGTEDPDNWKLIGAIMDYGCGFLGAFRKGQIPLA